MKTEIFKTSKVVNHDILGDSPDEESFLILKNLFGAQDIAQCREQLDGQAKKIEELLDSQLFSDKMKTHFLEAFVSEIENHKEFFGDSFLNLLRNKLAKSSDQEIQAFANVMKAVVQKSLAISSSEKDEQWVRSISETLPKAFDRHSEETRAEVVESMSPFVGAAIQAQVKNEKDKIVDALYPAIGAIIGKYMAESIQQIIENVNFQIESKLSIKGIFRKYRARLAGVSEADLFFEDSLQSKVDSIYIINKFSGIVIAQAHRSGLENENSNMLGGMFSAITSFVNDWIQKSEKHAEIGSIEYGGSQILFETTGSLVAAVVVGVGKTGLVRHHIRRFLELLLVNHDKVLSEFDGDPASIPTDVQTAIQGVVKSVNLDSEPKTPGKKAGWLRPRTLALVGGIFIVGALAYSTYVSYQGHRVQASIIDLFRKDAFLQNIGFIVESDSGSNVRISGLVPTDDYLRRARKLIGQSSFRGIDIDTSGIHVFAPPKVRSQVVERNRGIVQKFLEQGSAENLLTTAVLPGGVLEIRGVRQGKIDVQRLNDAVGGFFTQIRDSTKPFEDFFESSLRFGYMETSVGGENLRNLKKIVDLVRQSEFSGLKVFLFQSSPNLTKGQSEILRKRSVSIKLALKNEGYYGRVDVVSRVRSPFAKARVGTLLRDRYGIIVPIVDSSPLSRAR